MPHAGDHAPTATPTRTHPVRLRRGSTSDAPTAAPTPAPAATKAAPRARTELRVVSAVARMGERTALMAWEEWEAETAPERNARGVSGGRGKLAPALTQAGERVGTRRSPLSLCFRWQGAGNKGAQAVAGW